MHSHLIYILDDDPSVRKGLSRVLRSNGYRVQTFESLNNLLAGIRMERPNCLLLDLKMPINDGFDVQKQLSEIDLIIPIVFVSGHANTGEISEAFQKGAASFLLKPVEESDLIRTIESIT